MTQAQRNQLIAARLGLIEALAALPEGAAESAIIEAMTETLPAHLRQSIGAKIERQAYMEMR